MLPMLFMILVAAAIAVAVGAVVFVLVTACADMPQPCFPARVSFQKDMLGYVLILCVFTAAWCNFKGFRSKGLKTVKARRGEESATEI